MIGFTPSTLPLDRTQAAEVKALARRDDVFGGYKAEAPVLMLEDVWPLLPLGWIVGEMDSPMHVVEGRIDNLER